MGLYSGSVSYTKYVIDEQPSVQGNFFESVFKAVHDSRFRPLLQEYDSSSGWVNPTDIMSVEFERHHTLYEPYIVLALRKDKWSIPAAVFKSKFKEMWLMLYGNVNKLDKVEKANLKQETIRVLREDSSPRSSWVHVVWNYHSKPNVIRVFSTAESTLEMAELFFMSTFGRFFSDTFEMNRMTCPVAFEDSLQDPPKYGNQSGFLLWVLSGWACLQTPAFDGEYVYAEPSGRVKLSEGEDFDTVATFEHYDSEATHTCVRDGYHPSELTSRVVVPGTQFELNIDVVHNTVKSCTLPAILDNDPDNKMITRLELMDTLDTALDVLSTEFKRLRSEPKEWSDVQCGIEAWVG